MSVKDYVPLKVPGATTSSGTSREFPEVASFNRGVCYLSVTAASGTSPTLDVKIEEKDPVSGSWFTISTFTQVTTGTSSQRNVFEIYGTSVRANWTLGGTTPNFTFSVTLIAGSEEPIV
jgi:hypothetical protein